MGLFDFLKRVFNSAAAPPSAAPAGQGGGPAFVMNDGNGKPEVRPAHYFFAATRLWSYAFSDPDAFFGLMYSEQAREGLRQIWHATKNGQSPPDPMFDSLR